MDIRVWNRDDKPLTESEYEQEVVLAKNLRKEKKGTTRLSYWLMDYAYLKALRKGETLNEAHDAGIAFHALVGGLVAGFLAALFAVGTLSWFYGVLETASTVNSVLVIFVWLMIFLLGFRSIRKRLTGPFKRAWRAIRPQKEATAS